MADSTPVAKKSKPQTEAQKKIQPSVAKVKVSEVKVKELDKAAELLLGQIPDHAGELVHSLSKQFQIPLWQYLDGILLAVHLEGRLSEFRLDPAWKDGLKTKELKCKHCNKMFKPVHIGQPYCSNECGFAATGPEPHIEKTPIEEPQDNEPLRTDLTKHLDTNKPSDWNSPDPLMEAA